MSTPRLVPHHIQPSPAGNELALVSAPTALHVYRDATRELPTAKHVARVFWGGQQTLPAYKELLRDTVTWLDPWPGQRWLDLGCGRGQLTPARSVSVTWPTTTTRRSLPSLVGGFGGDRLAPRLVRVVP